MSVHCIYFCFVWYCKLFCPLDSQSMYWFIVKLLLLLLCYSTQHNTGIRHNINFYYTATLYMYNSIQFFIPKSFTQDIEYIHSTMMRDEMDDTKHRHWHMEHRHLQIAKVYATTFCLINRQLWMARLYMY